VRIVFSSLFFYFHHISFMFIPLGVISYAFSSPLSSVVMFLKSYAELFFNCDANVY
jgi:hypothetical protein